MICVTCENPTSESRTSNRRVDVGTYSIDVDDEYEHCDECGEDFHTGKQSKRFDRLVIAARRKHENLLSGSDIRRIRLSVGLSQADLESAVGIGPKTVVRWETDLGVQNKTVDDVLRLIEFDPDNLRLLIQIRQATRYNELVEKFAPEDHINRGELQIAIADGLERSDSSSANLQATADAIFDSIKTYRRSKIKRLTDETRVIA